MHRLFGAGAVGLSLSYALPLTGLLNGLLTSSAETEQEMVAVERVLEYSSVEPEVRQFCMPRYMGSHACMCMCACMCSCATVITAAKIAASALPLP